MHIVKRAIILAAGRGTRMQPVTNEIPKPLIKVNGIRMIETIIKALHYNGITEIYIVVGYLKEQFQFLIDTYGSIKLIENPYYDNSNNISSLFMARDYLSNCIILDGDQMIYNNEILKPKFQNSGYCCIWTDKKTDEWLLDVDGGVVQSCSRTGGNHGWQLFSISFWSKEDGMKLKEHLELEFQFKHNWDIYWDDVALFCYPKHYKLGIREINVNDIIEIDTLNELIRIDPYYQKYE